MNYDGIPGDVTTKGHEQWIQLGSFEWGIGRGITNAASSGADREADTPTVAEIIVTKDSDSATPSLIRASLGLPPSGEGKKVLIDFVKTDSAEPEPYIQVSLTDTLVASWSVSSGGDRPSERLALNFTAIEFKNIGMGPANETGTPDPAAYDLSTEVGS
jgi:type VI secretion system secreted protein Hcp